MCIRYINAASLCYYCIRVCRRNARRPETLNSKEDAMRIAVCDDEKVFRDVLLEYLKPYREDRPELSVTEFCSGEDLVAAYEREERFDLIFFDVEMTGITGVEAAGIIRGMDSAALFVFVTSHIRYVSEAFVLNAFQFLVKPVSKDLFDREFLRAEESYRKLRYKYKLSYKTNTVFLELGDIYYIETFGRKLKVVTKKDEYVCLGSIGEEERKLSGYNFVRSHKGILVNLRHVFRPEETRLTLSEGRSVPLSRHYRNELLSKLNKYISGCSV